MTAEVEFRASRLGLRGAAEITSLLWVYVIYALLRNLATPSPAVALRHAEQLLRLERPMGIDVGQRLRDAAHGFGWLATSSNAVYATHAVVAVPVLFLLYRYSSERYRRWRNIFVVMLGVGLLGFWLYPVMPPRILATSYHFVDNNRTLLVGHTPLPGVLVPHPNRLDVLGFSNPYAALPSMHVAWALFCAAAVWPLLKRRWLRWVVASYPVLMFAAVILTGHHWVLDGVAAVASLTLAALVVSGFERLLEHVRQRPPRLASTPLAT